MKHKHKNNKDGGLYKTVIPKFGNNNDGVYLIKKYLYHYQK
jgi:hypothetical protein